MNEENLSKGWLKLHKSILNWEWYSNINVRLVFFHILLKCNYQDEKWQGQIIEKGSFITSLEKLSIETGLSVKIIRNVLEKLAVCECIVLKTTNKNTLITLVNYMFYQSNVYVEGKQKTNEGQTKGKQRANEGQTKGKQRANEGQTKGKQRANKGQTKGKQRATTKELKNLRTKELKNLRTKELKDLRPKDSACVREENPKDENQKTPKPPKEKQIKNDYAEFVKMTSDEFTKLVDKHGEAKTQRFIEMLDNYKGSNGKTYTSDYRAILSWVVDRYDEDIAHTGGVYHGNRARANKPVQSKENDPYDIIETIEV